MEITRNTTTNKGPATTFIGDVYIQPVAAPNGPSRFGGAVVRFTPGARSAWHSHPNGQTLYVLEGVGYVQRRGGPIEIIRPGDRIWTEPNEEHWHGATANTFMAHLALQQYDENGVATNWGEFVTAEEYNAAPKL